MPFDLPTSLTFDQKVSGDLLRKMKIKKKEIIALFNKWDAQEYVPY